MFTHLHVHTEFSILDGASRIGELVDTAKSLGQSALAITDHGVMYGAVDFFNACQDRGIQPIIGCEVYVAKRTRFDKIKGMDDERHHLFNDRIGGFHQFPAQLAFLSGSEDAASKKQRDHNDLQHVCRTE